jgi:hypothetical protein
LVKDKERGDIITDDTEIKRIIKDCYEQLYAFGLLEEMDKLLETFKLPRLSQKETESLKRSVTIEGTESTVRNLPAKKAQTRGLHVILQSIQRRINTFKMIFKNRPGNTPKFIL